MTKNEKQRKKWGAPFDNGKWDNIIFSRETGKKNYTFHVFFSDYSGVGCCSSSIKDVISFNDVRDALGCYRYFQIPRILGCSAPDKSNPEAVNGYSLEESLNDMDKKPRADIKKIVRLLETAIEKPVITTKDLDGIKKAYNKVFSKTNPENIILEWGSLKTILRSEHYDEKWIDIIDVVAHEENPKDPEVKQAKELLKLNKALNQRNFNEKKWYKTIEMFLESVAEC